MQVLPVCFKGKAEVLEVWNSVWFFLKHFQGGKKTTKQNQRIEAGWSCPGQSEGFPVDSGILFSHTLIASKFLHAFLQAAPGENF